ncbi:MAG: hypothetical protein IKA71_07545, partial [Lentisphaeria bacterium]|nr:hypothetical protein [Lentisphaeria bacterium]
MTEKKFSQTLIASDYLVENVPSAVKIASGVTVEELVAFTVTGDARLFIYDGDMYITNADITGVFSDKNLGITFADGTVIAASDSISAAGDCVLLAGFTSSGKSAVTAVYGKSFVCIDETLYCDNAVNNWGGVYRIYPGESTLSGATFANNISTRGGAVYVGGGGVFTVSDSVFYKNSLSASGYGGAIANQESTSYIYGSTFTENSAGNGSAICNMSAASMTVANSEFYNNTGSAALTNLGPLTIGNLYFAGNSGAIANSSAVITVNGMLTFVTAGDTFTSTGGGAKVQIDSSAFLSETVKIAKVIDN